MRSLERRYRLLLHAYPRTYRSRRASEITATYLDLAGPARRWPRPGDVADVLRGGIRERLRANQALGAIGGLRLAAILALCGSAALAGHDLVYMLPSPAGYGLVPGYSIGPFAATALAPDVVWVLAGVAAVASTRLARALTVAALVLTGSVAVVAEHAGWAHLWLPVLIPQFALGLVALALPRERGWWARIGPAMSGVAVPLPVLAWYWVQRAGLMTSLLRNPFGARPGHAVWAGLLHWYPQVSYPAEEKLAAALIGATLAGDLVWVVRWRDGRGVWAALLLLQPAALLWLVPLSFGPGGDPRLDAVTVFAGVITALWAAVFLLAVKLNGLLRGRLDGLLAAFDARRAHLSGLLARPAGHSQGQCPACGQPLPPGVAPAAPPDQQRGIGLV